MTETLGTLSKKFLDLYKLKRTTFDSGQHEAMHVMTGFGIGVADELRIAVIEIQLRGYGRPADYHVDQAFYRQQQLYTTLKDWLEKRDDLNASENGIEQTQFQKTQCATVLLKDREVERLFALGSRIHETIFKLTGKRFINLKRHEIEEIDFAKVDFTVEAQALKTKYERGINNQVAKKSATILFNAVTDPAHAATIPAAGSPWHDAGARKFSPHKSAAGKRTR